MMSAAATTATAGDEPLRNLTRQDVISRTKESLRRVAAQVTDDEVADIVDGLENTSGVYEKHDIHCAVKESLRLWASRDQVGLTCTLKLSQEHILEEQVSMKQELRELKSNMEEKMAELEGRMIGILAEAVLAEERPQATQSAGNTVPEDQDQILQRLADLEEKFTKFMPKETEAKQKDAKTGAAKELTEEEKEEKKKEDDAWGHLKSYDEAFEELQKDKENNDLTEFSELSEFISENHGVWEEARKLMPAFYSNSLARLGSSVKLNYQPFFKDINELMEFHAAKKPMFDEQVKYVARETKGKAVIPGMKGRPRCEAKAAFKYTDETGTSWHRCTDIVRATILYHDIRSMYEGLELLDKLDQEGKMEIVEFNDRHSSVGTFKASNLRGFSQISRARQGFSCNWLHCGRYLTPMPGNYRDLQLSVKIDGMICELQLNTRIMAYVKEHAGHRSFEVSRELVAAVKESDSKRCDDILSWGKELLGDESVQEIVNEKEKPVLHEAARQGNADLVTVFLQYKADVNLKDNQGQTALHKAMAGGYERATWALICAEAKFDADQKGMTPLMEGLLKLRVNPAKEAVARCVSTLAQTMVAQGCFKQELEGLSAKLEVFVQERLHQSSDLIAACKDGNLQKVDRFLRDWADPNSRDIAGDKLHAVHVALHGGWMDFSAERAEVLRRLLEFRADPDATATTPEGEDCTALQVALKSSNWKAQSAVAALIQHGAHYMTKCARDCLQPWTAAEIQELKPPELIHGFLGTLVHGDESSVMRMDQSLMLKGRPVELLLRRGYEAVKRCEVDEDKLSQLASSLANVLDRHGHWWERNVFRAECGLEQQVDLVVSGAGGQGSDCNGEFRQIRLHNGKPLYQKIGGGGIIYFDEQWKMDDSDSVGAWYYMAPDMPAETPPEGQWTTQINDAEPAPVVSSRKDQECLLDHAQQLQYWVSLAVTAENGKDKEALLHAAVSCQALQDTAEDASVQRAAVTVAGMLRGQQQPDTAEGLLQHYAVEDFAVTKTLHDSSRAILSVAWRGDLLATGGHDSKVRIYDGSQDFTLLKTLEEASDYIQSVAFCQDLLATGGDDRKVRIYDSSEDFLLVKTIHDATGYIYSLSFAGRLLAVGGRDKTVRIYDGAQDFLLVKTLQEASDYIRSVAWSQHLLAAGGNDKIVRIYDGLQDFTAVKCLEEASDWIKAVTWSNGLLALGGDDSKVRIYDTSQDYVLVRTLDEARKGIGSLSWGGKFLATGSKDSRVRIYDMCQDFMIVKILEMPENMCALDWRGSNLAVGAEKGQVSVFDTENVRWGAFEVDRLWDYAKRSQVQEELSPSSKRTAAKDAD